jgi:hypothetical protein
MFIMNRKNVLFGTVGLIGVGGLLYAGINKRIDKSIEKRENELRKVESEWHNAGWNAGYEAGKRDAEFEYMVKEAKSRQEVH